MLQTPTIYSPLAVQSSGWSPELTCNLALRGDQAERADPTCFG